MPRNRSIYIYIHISTSALHLHALQVYLIVSIKLIPFSIFLMRLSEVKIFIKLVAEVGSHELEYLT